MTRDRTYAADIDASRDAAEMAKHGSKDSERAKSKTAKEEAERRDADALAAAAGQNGQT
jgi:hypothetical protein